MMSEQIIPKEYVDLANVQRSEENALLAKENVVGVALGNKHVHGEDTGDKALIVLVETKLPQQLLRQEARVPETVGKIRTDVQEVGVIQAGRSMSMTMPSVGMPMPGTTVVNLAEGSLAGREELTMDGHPLRVSDVSLAARENVGPFVLVRRVRPAFGGVSVGHVNVTAGTLGTVVYDRAAFPGIPPRYYILSNNHVLANSNAANIGDPILQPGRVDGGTFPADVIARLSRFVPIRFIQPNQPPPINFVDGAIAEGNFADLDRQIYWIGQLRGVNAAPPVGTLVEKTGRTTNFTTGRIQNINATVDVNYGGGRVARYQSQILTSAISAGGDSGSLVADLDERAVGLLFAGSAQITVINPILLVEQLLGIIVAER